MDLKGSLLLCGKSGTGKTRLAVNWLKAQNLPFKLISYGQLLQPDTLIYESPRRKLLTLLQGAEVDGTAVLLFVRIEDFLEDAALWIIFQEYLAGSGESGALKIIATVAKDSKWLPSLKHYFHAVLQVDEAFNATAEAAKMIKFEGLTPEEAQMKLRGLKAVNSSPAALTLDSIFGVPQGIKAFLLESATFKRSIRGVLLSGPPGTGKTRLAAALAGSLGAAVKVLNLASSDLLRAEVGRSEELLREAFGAARAASPAMIFLDEIEALCPEQADLGHLSTILDQFCAEFDALERDTEGDCQVFVLAATNFPEKLNRRLKQAGRLECQIELGLPGAEERREILANELKSRLDSDTLSRLVNETEGFSPAQIVQFCKSRI